MIERYTRAAMGEIWSLENQYRSWLEVELRIVEGLAERGHIPRDVPPRLRANARFRAERIAEIETRVRHDMAAFVENVGEGLGEDARYFHWGITSSDVLDTALAVRLRQAGALLLAGQDRLAAVLAARAREHRRTLVVGRTHGMHAEPTSLGLKFLSWYAEACRNRRRLETAVEEVSWGKVSGAVGNFAHLEPEVEAHVCRALGLRADPVSTQVVARDRHAVFLSCLALLGAALERIALEIRHWQRSEVREAGEAFSREQKGSSSMPHKRNPVVSERTTGLARLLRAYAGAALENIALWHERDISHSSVERVVFPDATILLDFLLHDTVAVLEGLAIDAARMRENLEQSGGLIYSQRILMELLKAGLVREQAYRLTQELARESHETGRSFREVALASPRLGEHFRAETIAGFFDPVYFLKHVDSLYERAGLGQS